MKANTHMGKSRHFWKYMPNSKFRFVAFTMLHLMNHTAGFQETVWNVEVTDREKIISLKDALLSTAPA